MTNSTMKPKFGDRIEFTEIFHDVVYIAEKDLKYRKIYDGEEIFTVVPQKESFSRPGEYYFPAALRKVIFKRSTGSGIIVGQKNKREGFYHPGCSGSGMDFDDYEPAYLEVTGTYTFWVVATGLNQTVLVPK